jgi:LysR family transcriptional regulator for bpeEF and oprC
MDKLSAMLTFTAVAEAGSFTKAADVLGLPKATVSQRISGLERHLEVRLLHRTTRALTLTDDGQAYFERCQVILQEIAEVEGALRSSTAKPRGRLRIECLASVARWVIAPKLHEFRRLYPELSVRLGSNDRISHLLEDGIDVAIRGGHLGDSTLIARPVCDVQFGLYASSAYITAAGQPAHPLDLTAHQLLSWFGGQRNSFAWRLESAADSCELPAGDGLRFDDPDVAIAACIAGCGICPGSPFAVETWVRAGLLIPILPQWSFPPRPIHLIYPSKKQLSMKVRVFVDWALASMRLDQNIRLTPWDLARSLQDDANRSSAQ